MKNIFKQDNLLNPLKTGEIVEGKIIGAGSSGLFIDLGVFGTGVVYKKEFRKTKDSLKNLKTGDTIFAKVTEPENEDGYFGLSLAEAQQELAWRTLEEIKEKDEIMKVKISKVNRGGVMAETSEVSGFLPLSQLSSVNYPRVEGGNSTKIVQELQKLIGKTLEVKIFDLNPKQKKLIFSEKAGEIQSLKQAFKKYKVGDVVEGEITGIVDFGAFIRFPVNKPSNEKESLLEDKSLHYLEGLIHISELPDRSSSDDSDGGDKKEKKVNHPSAVLKIGEIVKAKIINITNDRIYLSLKNLDSIRAPKVSSKSKQASKTEEKPAKERNS